MMSRCLVPSAVLLLSVSSVFAQEGGDALAKKLKEDPDNVAAITAFMKAKLSEVYTLSRSDPDAALKMVAEMRTVFDSVTPDRDRARKQLKKARNYLGYVQEQLMLMKTPIEELVKRLEQNSADAKVVSHYVDKVRQTAAELVMSDPDKAGESIKKAKLLLGTLREKGSGSKEVIAAIDRAEQSMTRIEQFIHDRIEREQELAALVGKDAAPLKADAWVNGQPLTDEALKGKVVLLDFWAVWCGPCIRTFPHLREWHEMYKDQGLIIIGVTNYTKEFAWDAEENEMVRMQSEVSPRDERAMLVEFAKQYELKHVFAVQSDSTLSEYYAVKSIPQVVLIDRKNTVRMVKMGAGPDTSQEIGAMLRQVIAEQGADASPADGAEVDQR